MKLYAGIDIGGTKSNIGILDEAGRILAKCRQPVGGGAPAALKRAAEALVELLNGLGARPGDVQSCGIGVPGTVSADGRTVLAAPNLGWENEPCAQLFEDIAGIPACLVQDSRAAAFGEYKLGAAKGRRLVVCVTLGTGIGTGIVLDGDVFCGALGSAGEVGHIVARPGGRPCACGRKGCVETYSSGRGIALTASEHPRWAGKAVSSEEVFTAASSGDAVAQDILQEAVALLGAALTSVINVLSPDALIFSGGMCAQRELYVKPLEDYIRSHAYPIAAGKSLLIATAALGEDAPMAGAALLGRERRADSASKLSASLMCSDLLNVKQDLILLEEAGVDFLHFDIMDSHFVPNLMLPPDFVRAVRRASPLPFDIHLMVENPEKIIPLFDLKAGDVVSVHYESTPHVHRALSMIKDRGATAALALNPATPVECVREVLPDISMVLLMTVNPGYAGQKLVPQGIEKIARMRAFLDGLGYSALPIEVDGNCSFENAPKMRAAGASVFVVGSSSVFDPNLGIAEGAARFRKACQG